MFPFQPTPEEPQEITEAKKILRWMDQNLEPGLPDAWRPAYRQARQRAGSPATTNRARFWPGGPAIHAPRMPVRGTGDDAYGHERVTEIVRQVVIPMIEAGEISQTTTAQLLQTLRGPFGGLYREVEIASWRSNNKDKEGGE